MLYVVPTPIGNLSDITLRALEVLRSVDLIACEDTRTSRVLLDRHGVSTPATSFHEHNARSRAPKLADRIELGDHIALISDAGTPGISDPGFVLVRECIERDIKVEVLPGPTAFVPALILSGLPVHRFSFEGFLPPKKGRKSRLDAIAQSRQTVILYESPHRLLRTLRDLEEVIGGDRSVSVSRELTKRFEETLRGPLKEVRDHFESLDKVRGEFVIVVGPGATRSRERETTLYR